MVSIQSNIIQMFKQEYEILKITDWTVF